MIAINADPVSGAVKVSCMIDDGTTWAYPAEQVERSGRRYGWVSGDWTEEAYPALIDDERWNGWAIPYFDLETARRVVADQSANLPLGEDASNLEWLDDKIVLRDLSYPDAEPELIGPDLDGLYCVGGRSWTWYETDPGPRK